MAQARNAVDLSKELVRLGSDVADALRNENPEALDKLDEYSALFDEWQKNWSKSAAGTFRFGSKDVALAKRIAKQHETVLELTEVMYRAVGDSLKELRGRSKGIRAYLDHLPSKISTIRSRKG